MCLKKFVETMIAFENISFTVPFDSLYASLMNGNIYFH